MSNLTVKQFSDLRKRVGRFLSSKAYGRDEVGRLLTNLQEVGDMAIFGGMLRDISLTGNSGFSSDIDLVISCDDKGALQRALGSLKFRCVLNKFGGYRLLLSKWKVDIWALESTWAFREGLLSGRSFEDLIRTTFFDWDAIAYEVGTASIFAVDGYLERLEKRTLDINLERNPNPLGNSVKALRYAEKYGAKFTTRLSRYVDNHLGLVPVTEICAMERRSHENPMLLEHVTSDILGQLRSHQEKFPLIPFERASYQHDLWKASQSDG